MTKDMLPQGERTSLLQAEVHYRSTQDVNRFTILLNNMRLMGIFDWWTAVLQFISKSTDNPNPPVQKDVKECKKHHINKMEEETKFSGVDVAVVWLPVSYSTLAAGSAPSRQNSC